MHRAVLLLVLVTAAAMAPPAQPGRLSAVNPWLSACDLSDTDEPYGQHERVCDELTSRERDRLLSTTYLQHCRERSLMSALSEGARSDAIGGGVACLKVLGDLRTVDDIAARASQDLGSILARYDCGQTFSVIHKCSNCQESYRRWVCSALLPFYVSSEPVVVGQGAHQGGAGGRGARSASSNLPPRLQPPPPSPPRKRSTSRDNYKQYASNNKNTKLKMLTDSEESVIIFSNNINININTPNNINYNKLNKDKITNTKFSKDNYDDNLYRNRFYETIILETNSAAVDDTSDVFLSANEDATSRLPNSNPNLIINNKNKYRKKDIYRNITVGEDKRPGDDKTKFSNDSSIVERPWNERSNARNEQRAADARKDLDNRLERPGGSVDRKSRKRRNTTSADSGRYRLRPCLSICQDVERTCPYFLPGDRAPSYPTQYAGEPTFLCLDPNIEETGEQLRKSNYGNMDCCYSYCGPSDDQICWSCTEKRKRPTLEQPHAPQCSSTSNSLVTSTIPPTTSRQARTTSSNLVIVFIGLSVSCAHCLLVTNNIYINSNENQPKQNDCLAKNNENKQLVVSQNNNFIHTVNVINSSFKKCLKILSIVECLSL